MIAVGVLLAAAFLYPRPWVVGGLQGGPIGPGESAYREDYSCLGLRLAVPAYNCVDCAALYPCFGVRFGRACSIERYEPGEGVTRTPVPCR